MKKLQLKFLNIPFVTKGAKEENGEMIIEGYGAVKNNVDSSNELITDGAMTKTLLEQGDRIALCYQHDIRTPIGKIIEIREDEKGLFIRARISDSEEKIKTKIREGILKEMSIGYVVLDAKTGKKDDMSVIFLTELKIYEVSLVTRAANNMALIDGFKGEAGETNMEVIEAEIDRILANEKNKEKKFDILMLKALIMEVLPVEETTEKKDEPQVKSDCAILFNSDLFTNKI